MDVVRPAYRVPKNASTGQKLLYPFQYVDAYMNRPPYAAVTHWIYFLLGGWAFALAYILVGLLQIITIIFIPYGMQTLRSVPFVAWPFGKSIVRGDADRVVYEGLITRLVQDPCHPFTIFANVVWLLTAGWLLILGRIIVGGLLVLSVVGYAAGLENFRAIPWTAWPFGYVIAQITRVPDYPFRSAAPPMPPSTTTSQMTYSPAVVA